MRKILTQRLGKGRERRGCKKVEKLRLKLLRFIFGTNVSIFATQEIERTKEYENTGFKLINLEICDAKKRKTILQCELRCGQKNQRGVQRIDILRVKYGEKKTADM